MKNETKTIGGSSTGHQGAQGDHLALVVDDNFAFRTLASAYLQRSGFAVREAVDAEQALQWLRSATFDLMLLDIHMPGMQGDELCRHIRSELGLRDLPIIAYTADGLGTSIEIVREAGFDDLLMKPVSRSRLDQILAERFPGVVAAGIG